MNNYDFKIYKIKIIIFNFFFNLSNYIFYYIFNNLRKFYKQKFKNRNNNQIIRIGSFFYIKYQYKIRNKLIPFNNLTDKLQNFLQ